MLSRVMFSEQGIPSSAAAQGHTDRLPEGCGCRSEPSQYLWPYSVSAPSLAHMCACAHVCFSVCTRVCYLVCAHVCGACVCTHVWCVSSCMYTWERECVYLCACVHACCVPCVVCVHTCVVCGFHVCALWCVYTVWCVSVRVHVCCPCAVHVWLHVAFMCVHGPSTELPPRPPPLMAAATHACPAGHHPPPEFTLGLCPPTAESAGTHQLAERHPTAPGPLQNPPGPPLNEGLQGSPVSPANTSRVCGERTGSGLRVSSLAPHTWSCLPGWGSTWWSGVARSPQEPCLGTMVSSEGVSASCWGGLRARIPSAKAAVLEAPTWRPALPTALRALDGCGAGGGGVRVRDTRAAARPPPSPLAAHAHPPSYQGPSTDKGGSLWAGGRGAWGRPENGSQ